MTTNEQFRWNWVRQQLAEIPAGSTLLDVGAGECFYKPDAAHLTYVAQDLATYDGAGDGRGLQTKTWDTSQIDIVCDILEMPEDRTFDAVLCSEVLEHVPDAPAVLRKLCKLVSPGGRLIVTAPFVSMTHFAPQHYATGFSRYFYEHHLTRYGLEISKIEPNGTIFELGAQEFDRAMDSVSTYSGSSLNGIIRRIGGRLTRHIARYGKNYPQAAEIGCFGWNVLAFRSKN